jgi:hypothetical protein
VEDAGLAGKESETACEEVGVKNSQLKYETKRGVKTTPLPVILFIKSTTAQLFCKFTCNSLLLI